MSPACRRHGWRRRDRPHSAHQHAGRREHATARSRYCRASTRFWGAQRDRSRIRLAPHTYRRTANVSRQRALAAKELMRKTTPLDRRSVQAEDAVDGAELGRLDQLLVRHADRMQRPFQLVLPEGQERFRVGELREKVVVLPDVALQQPAVVRTPVKDLRGGQAVPSTCFWKSDETLATIASS